MSDTLQFFDALFEHKPDAHTVVLWFKSDKSKRTAYMLSPERAADDALNATGYDVYTGVGYAPPGASKTLGPKRRPGKAQVSGIVGLWADIDVNGGPEAKRGAAPDKAAAVALANVLVPPSLVVDSGYGIQAWWLFGEPWLFGESREERAGAQELAHKWLNALQAQCDFKLDMAHDPSRVLRVPGTFNHKGGAEMPVRLLECNDARYELDDFYPHVADVQLSLPHTNGSSPADEIVVVVNQDAKPPFDKFEALAEADADFKASWHRNRREPKAAEWSASEYDFALADRAARARWTDQEITDLLVAARVKHGDDLKRPDYYARTIARIRATIEVAAVEQRRKEAIDELTQPAVTAMDSDPAHVLSLFEEVVGVPLDKFVQYGRDPDEGGTFELVLAGEHAGRRIRFPNFDELGNPMKFRNRIATATSVLPERIKGGEWDKVIRRLLEIVEVFDSPHETSIGVLDEWLAVYLSNTEAGDRGEALRSGYPHHHEGKLYVSRGHLQHYLKTRFGENVRRRDLTALLKAAGFRSEHVSYRKSNGAATSTTLFARATGDE